MTSLPFMKADLQTSEQLESAIQLLSSTQQWEKLTTLLQESSGAHSHVLQSSAKFCDCIAAGGSLRALKFARQLGCPWRSTVCEKAARHGRLDCLEYAHREGCRIPQDACEVAARLGNLDCLRYCCENYIFTSENDSECSGDECNSDLSFTDYDFAIVICQAAIAGSHLDCLKYLIHRYKRDISHLDDGECCLAAASHGHLSCLKILCESKCQCNEETCDVAAENGHLECLKYLSASGYPLSLHICDLAARNGHIECLRFAYEHGCPISSWTCEEIILGMLDPKIKKRQSQKVS